MWKKWKERDTIRLRKLERVHQALLSEVEFLRMDIRNLQKAVKEKEVTHTHVQRIEVDVSKRSSWEDFPY